MLIQSKRLETGIITDRRALLRGVGTVGLSAAAVAILGGCESMAASNSASAADVDILNVALGLEHEAINAYQLGAESGLLDKPVLDVAVLFQSHHKAHRDALVSTIQKMGGKPVAEKSIDDYATALNAGSLKNQGDVLQSGGAAREGRGQRLSRRDPVLQRQRPQAGLRPPGGRRDDALDRPRQRAGREPALQGAHLRRLRPPAARRVPLPQHRLLAGCPRSAAGRPPASTIR